MRDYGGTNADTHADATQTQTALFYSDAGIVPMQAGLRDFATRHALNIADSARMFAAADTTIADGAITVWNAKLQYMWWRPVTAIRERRSMAIRSRRACRATMSDVADHHAAISGLAERPVLGRRRREHGARTAQRERTLDLKIVRRCQRDADFETKTEITIEAVDARVWSGIHFRTADEVSIVIGTNVANYVLDHYFQPTD